MKSWNFPSRSFAETEGLSNAALAEFKGKPLKALAREICQNSLDAADGSGNPVRVEFHVHNVKIYDFPGMSDMKRIIDACGEFWNENGDKNTKLFIEDAKKKLKRDSFFVLRISDYNTKGVSGAFKDDVITPWGSLVKGNAFSVKYDQSNAAGSFGIGKAAPFVSSFFQTVFYRTIDEDGERAALGVSRLMAHKSINPVLPGEDPIRRSVGYFGEQDDSTLPSHEIKALDDMYKRTERGTDLFIPGFSYITSNDDWKKEILAEIAENFLYSIYSGKLEIVVEDRKLNKSNLRDMLRFLGNKAKDSNIYYNVIDENNTDVITATYENFHSLGSLKLRLLFDNDLNKKVLVVRNSGMRIAKLPGLPRIVSFTGFLEICGDKLNDYFRNMENPKHDAWEPNRYNDPAKIKQARAYKEELVEWVIENINKKLIEISGEESPVDMADCLDYQDPLEQDSRNNKEAVIDTVKNIQIIKRDTPVKKTKILDLGGDSGRTPNERKGIIDDSGNMTGHRHRTGKRQNAKPTGRKGSIEVDGPDRIYDGMKEVVIIARVISKNNGKYKLIFTPEKDITRGVINIVTRGENGKSLSVFVNIVDDASSHIDGGAIIVENVPSGQKKVMEFEISEKRNLALGVKAYGN